MSTGGTNRTDESIIVDLYDDLVRFAAVIAPPDVDPDDLVHDAFVRTMSRHSLVDLDQPQAFLRRTVVNLASNRRRSFGRWLRAMSRVGPAVSSEDEYPSDVAALLDLTPQTRAVVWLADVEGLSFDVIADTLGLSAAAARQRASRAHKELRTRIEQGEFRDPIDLGGASQ